MLRILLAIHKKVLKAKFSKSDELFSFVGICKFGSFKNLFVTIINLSELYFRFRISIYLIQKKKGFLLLPFSWFLRTMPVAQAAEIHGVEWNLTWYLRWGIYSLIPAWTHSENSLAATEALNLKISPYLSNDHKDCPNQKNSPKLHNEIGHPLEFNRKSVETETT